MKIKIVFTFLLFIFSLLYLDNAINFVKKNDKLMQDILLKEDNYNTKPYDAVITFHTMIPGIYGKKINLNASYKKMKKMNYFDESLLVYDDIIPLKSINNHFDKIIISGNKKKNNVSIILTINDIYLFNSLNKVLISNNVKADIYTNNDYYLLDTNYQNVITNNYNDFTNYCLTFTLEINSNCLKNKKFTILGKSISNYFLNNTEKNVENGSILVYNFNENNYTELNLIIKYLKNNNYQIVTIDELVKE